MQPLAKALANHPESLRRAYTSAKASSEPVPVLREATLPQLTPMPAQHVSMNNPASTGAVTPTTPDARRAVRVETKNAAKRAPLRQAQLNSDVTHIDGSQGHRPGRAKGLERIEPSRGRSDVRQARAVRREGRPARIFLRPRRR